MGRTKFDQQLNNDSGIELKICFNPPPPLKLGCPEWNEYTQQQFDTDLILPQWENCSNVYKIKEKPVTINNITYKNDGVAILE
jgi:hypothetical protein